MVIPKINSAHGSDTRNILNRAIDLINVQGKSIQDLVAEGQLTPEQYAQLIRTVNGLISKGEITMHDIDRNNFKIDETMVAESLLKQITGTAAINAVPADKSITNVKLAPKSVSLDKTSFTKKTRNLFNGSYDNGILATYGSNTGIYYTWASQGGFDGRVAVIPISHNTTYTIKVHDEDLKNQFRLATNSSYPVFSELLGDEEVDNLVVNNESLNVYTFTNTQNDNFLLVYVSNEGKEPRLQVEEGSMATEYISGLYIPEYLVEAKKISKNDLDFLKEADNLFDGNYSNGLLVADAPLPDKIESLFPTSYFTGVDGRVAIIPIEANKTYTIKVHEPEKQNVFRVGVSSELVTFTSPATEKLDRVINYGLNTLKSEVTFTNTSNGRFLYIYVSNEGQEPKMKVEEGDEATELKERYIIPSSFLEIPESVEDKNKGKYNFFVNLDTFYKYDEIADFIPNPLSFTVSEYNTMFNNLINQHSDTAKSTLLGKGEFDYDLYKYENNPEPYKKYDGEITSDVAYENVSHKKYPLPKILITANIHGRERTTSYASYYFFKELMENPKNDPVLDFIKRNVHLILVPVICGSGFEDNTYENRNGQNLNRDFAPHGDFTQAESKLVKKVIDENSDMDFHLDFHTTPFYTDAIGYTLTDVEELALIGNNMYRELGRKWQLEYPEMPQDLNHEWGYSSYANIGTAGRYSHEVHGIPSVLFEVVQKLNWINGNSHDKYVTQMGVEMLANMVIGVLRSKQ